MTPHQGSHPVVVSASAVPPQWAGPGAAAEPSATGETGSPAVPGRFLVFLPASTGGIARYAAEQVRELAARGHEVSILCAVDPGLDRSPTVRVATSLYRVPDAVRSHLTRRLLFAAGILFNHFLLVRAVVAQRPNVVLFDAYSETLAPLWAWPHVLIGRALRIRYSVTIHDPDRRKRRGPMWWHRLSVWAAYLPFHVGLIHGLDPAQRARVPRHVALADVPHGIFALEGRSDGRSLRRRLGIAHKSAVALAFGYVADRKNLDIAIRAVAAVEELHLIVAGRRVSSTDRPVIFYRDLAKSLGLSDRVHFLDDYIPEAEVGELFAASDVVLLTYRREFISQSGVLHMAANWEKPVVASGGPGPLIDAVRRHRLGVVVEPDSVQAVTQGLGQVLAGHHQDLGWDTFRHEASWQLNIDRLLQALASTPSTQIKAPRPS